jgi:hypothetical protein
MENKQNPPRRNPIVAGFQSPPDNSMAGASNDQKLAAIITPAAKPSNPSMTL